MTENRMPGGAGLKLVKEFLLYLWLSNVIDLRIVLR